MRPPSPEAVSAIIVIPRIPNALDDQDAPGA